MTKEQIKAICADIMRMVTDNASGFSRAETDDYIFDLCEFYAAQTGTRAGVFYMAIMAEC